MNKVQVMAQALADAADSGAKTPFSQRVLDALEQLGAEVVPDAPPVECAICGDYTAAGVEVHESCLARARLTFAEVARVNAARCDRWHHGFPVAHDERGSDGWSGADWSNAMQGEAGEAGNVVKKLRRIDLGLWGNRKPGDDDRDALVAKLAAEGADTFIYLDLLMTFYGIDFEAAIIAKFNRISEEAGFPERLPGSR